MGQFFYDFKIFQSMFKLEEIIKKVVNSYDLLTSYEWKR